MTALPGTPVAVTGGAHGIGRAIAGALAAAGARVAIGDLDGPGARDAAAALGGDALGLELDVRDPGAFAAFLDAAEQRHGPLGALVNNAGVDWVGPFHDEPDAATRRQLDVNLYGMLVGSRLALRRMLPRGGGHIVNVASGVGRVPFPGSATYSATKHGVVGLTESLRLEYRRSGVRFSLVLPAQVETAMIEGQARPRALPLIQPGDVAEAVVGALETGRFEVWVPRSQGASAKLSAILPRRLREPLLLALGVGRIAGETDLAARRGYHERAFGE